MYDTNITYMLYGVKKIFSKLPQSKKGELHGQIKFLWAYLNSKMQDKADETILEFFRDAPTEKNRDRKILFALDTDIGNITQFEIDELLKQIRDVSSLLGDIEFVAGTGENLAGLIKDAKSKIKTDNIDVIVVTKKKKEDFDSSYHIVRTDDSRLDPGSYVPILELLTFALLINLEDNDVLLQEIYKEITGNELTSELKEQIKNGISAIPLPPSERISPDFYNTSIEVLKSA